MNDAEVIRFKMTADKNTWAQYFGLHCGNTYYKGLENKGVANFVLGRHTNAEQNNKLRLNIGAGKGVDTNIALSTMYTKDNNGGLDIANANGVSVNVEVGSVKVFYNEDGEQNYVGRLFYIEFDGVRVMEYVYFNDSLAFEGGNFFIGGNTEKIVIEKFDLEETNSQNGGFTSNESVNNPVFNGNVGGFSGAQVVTTNKNTKNYVLIVLSIVAILSVVTVISVKAIKRKD